MSIAAASVDCDDLRLCYSTVMKQIEIVPDGTMALSGSHDGNPILSSQAKATSEGAVRRLSIKASQSNPVTVHVYCSMCMMYMLQEMTCPANVSDVYDSIRRNVWPT